MNDIYSLEPPYFIAHRGASAFAPENTLSAFRLAVEHGADAVELDAKLSSDGRVVVIHDQTLNRTAGVEGRVRDFSLSDLKTLDVGSFFDNRFSGEKIPALDEVFEEVGRKLLINVEITNYETPDDLLPEKIAEIVKSHAVQDRVHFSSFNPNNLNRIKKLLSECPVGLLTPVNISGLLSSCRKKQDAEPEFMHPYHLLTLPGCVKRQHKLNRRVHVWTVNKPRHILRMLKMRVDGIITDNPKLARELALNK